MDLPVPTILPLASMDFSDDYKNYLREVILILKENIYELNQKQLSADSEEKEYIAGRLYSYQEVISSLKNTIKNYGITEEEIGLHLIQI